MILDDLRLILAPDELARFLTVFAGNDFRFEKTAGGASFAQLERVVGADAAERLRMHFAGERVYIPRNRAEERARRDDEIRARLAAGESPASIARSYRVVTTLSERWVRQIAAGKTRRDRESDESAGAMEGAV